MILVKAAENAGPPPKALMDAIDELAADATRAGKMVASGGLAPTAMSTAVRLRGGQLNIVDGPFSEAKEVVGGYAVFDFASKDEAIKATREFMELHRTHWPGWDGESEIRQVFGPADFPPRS
jgi:hypothetical protein